MTEEEMRQQDAMRQMQDRFGLEEEQPQQQYNAPAGFAPRTSAYQTPAGQQGYTATQSQRTEQGGPAGQGGAPDAGQGDYKPKNGLYELKDCKVIKIGELERFGEHCKRTITFEYMAAKSDKPYQICADAWNDTLEHGDFQLMAYYDLSIRVGCRTAKDGRDFANVTIAFANRLRVVTMM